MNSKIQSQEYREAMHELIRVGDWIRWAASVFQREELFFGHGTDNPWDEAVQLVLQMLHLPVESDPLVFHAMVLPNEREQLLSAIKQRVEERKPLPYITHQAWCMGLSFYVDERVLIPRSPFAEWIQKHFQPWVQPEQVEFILEIGTGSGCLAVASAMTFPNAKVDAVDIDERALDVARLNVLRYNVADQVALIHSDNFEGVAGKQYDIILSNPPYVGAEEMLTLPPEYHHEPQSALEAKDDGLELVLRIIAEARYHLRPNGVLVVEVGNSEEALVERLPHVPFVWLEQENGGHGLFLLTKQQLDELHHGG